MPESILKKYKERPSPPFPANDYCNKKLKGNDGNMYISLPDKNGICKWKRYIVEKLKKKNSSPSRRISRRSAKRITNRKSRSRKSETSYRFKSNTHKKGCREMLSDKISINMKEYKKGRYSSPKQSIAVSYSQIKKMYPKCSTYLKKSK